MVAEATQKYHETEIRIFLPVLLYIHDTASKHCYMI